MIGQTACARAETYIIGQFDQPQRLPTSANLAPAALATDEIQQASEPREDD
jgi:hypothetical protein